MTTATLEQPQHLQALALADSVRFARAELKRDIRNGVVTLPEVLLAEIPDWLIHMRVEDLLKAQNRVGQRISNRFCQKAQCHPHKEVGYLTMRQRIVLAALSEGFGS